MAKHAKPRERDFGPIWVALAFLMATFIAFALVAIPVSAAPHRHGCSTYTHNGNTISRCAAGVDPYVPNVSAASPRDKRIARQLLNKTLQWHQRNNTPAKLRAHGYRPPRPGATHWTLPIPVHRGRYVPGKPAWAVIHKGRVVGALYVARHGFPYLGSIPRPHAHHPPREMLHVWISDSLKVAYTTKAPWRTGHGHKMRPSSPPRPNPPSRCGERRHLH